MAKLGRSEVEKYHALGNDYVVVDPKTLGTRLSRARIREICDRHRGVGADGILALAESRAAHFGLRIFNPDGSEAEKSGNGLRIFACFLARNGYTRRRTITIETSSGIATASVTRRAGSIVGARVTMGHPSFWSRDVPVRGPNREVVNENIRVGLTTFQATCVSMGNPHCVVFVPRLSGDELRHLGPEIERHSMFPNRTNVQFARVVSRRTIEALVWERGAGETQASGSSACAVAAAAQRLGVAGRSVSVAMPGGRLRVERGGDGILTLTGPVTPIFRARM